MFLIEVSIGKPVKVWNVKSECPPSREAPDDFEHNLLDFIITEMLKNAEHKDAIKYRAPKRKAHSVADNITTMRAASMAVMVKVTFQMYVAKLRVSATADLKIESHITNPLSRLLSTACQAFCVFQ